MNDVRSTPKILLQLDWAKQEYQYICECHGKFLLIPDFNGHTIFNFYILMNARNKSQYFAVLPDYKVYLPFSHISENGCIRNKIA